MSEPKEQTLPYTVEVDAPGCEHCGADRLWAVVGPDGLGDGMSWTEQCAADAVADHKNEGYIAGMRAAAAIAKDCQTGIGAEAHICGVADQLDALLIPF